MKTTFISGNRISQLEESQLFKGVSTQELLVTLVKDKFPQAFEMGEDNVIEIVNDEGDLLFNKGLPELCYMVNLQISAESPNLLVEQAASLTNQFVLCDQGEGVIAKSLGYNVITYGDDELVTEIYSRVKDQL